MEPMMPVDNEFQFLFIDLFFALADTFTNLIIGFLFTGVTTEFFNFIFGIFQQPAM